MEPSADIVLLGGDFNSTLHVNLDRSRLVAQSAHDSPGLSALLRRWKAVDVLAADMEVCENEQDVHDFHSRTHTYVYRAADGRSESSRLDRWYRSVGAADWVRSCELLSACDRSDHDGVLIRIADPARCNKVRKRPKVYPLGPDVNERALLLCRGVIERDRADVCDDPFARWDAFKVRLRISCLEAASVSRRKVALTFKQRVRRLRASIAAMRKAISARDLTTPTTVEAVTTAFELLSLDTHERLVRMRDHLATVVAQRRERVKQRTFERYARGVAGEQQSFFARFSPKFQPPAPLHIAPRPGRPATDGTRVAETLADDWQPALQQTPPTGAAIDSWFASLPPARHSIDWSFATADFTDLETEAGLKCLSTGKATGPDRLPNEWLKDLPELIPILTRLYTACLRAGEIPDSFVEAIVTCLPKVLAPRSGMDFRPISLLNTDYKLLARLLATRVEHALDSVIH